MEPLHGPTYPLPGVSNLRLQFGHSERCHAFDGLSVVYLLIGRPVFQRIGKRSFHHGPSQLEPIARVCKPVFQTPPTTPAATRTSANLLRPAAKAGEASGLTSEPPLAPRLRTAGSAMTSATFPNNGMRSRSRESASSSACVKPAPMITESSFTSMRLSSGT